MKTLIHGADITRFLNSRYCVMLTVAGLIATATIHGSGMFDTTSFSTHSLNIFGFSSPAEWITSPSLSLIAGVVATLAISALLFFINTTFNLLRSMSLIYSTIFIMAISAIPTFISNFYSGQLLALLTFGALCPLFSTYQQPSLTRRVFLSFLLLTTGLIFCCQATAWMVYLPVFLAGIGQMRILSLKTLLAAVVGTLTPLWILWGFGIIDSMSLTWPSAFTLSSPPVWFSLQTAIYMAVIILLWLGMSVFNLVRIYNYNARLRAYNGLFSLLGLATLLVMILDPDHVPTYLPTFAGCMGFQAGHFFTINHGSRSWIGILSIMIPFWLIYLWVTAL